MHAIFDSTGPRCEFTFRFSTEFRKKLKKRTDINGFVGFAERKCVISLLSRAMVDEGVKFDEIHLQTGDMPINWRRRRSAKCLLRLGFVEG